MISWSSKRMTEVFESTATDGKRAWYAVTLCMLAFILSYTDRQVLSLLVEPIKHDLGINDTQFGLLQGLAFSVFFAVVGLPIASMSDRRSRPAIVACGVLVWSAATMVCGLARTFPMLLLARMGVGTGEATLSPATYSLISDLFPPEQLGRPTAVYSLGSFLGAGFAFIVGGAVIAAYAHAGPLALGPIVLRPWQIVMMTVGTPGLLLSAVIALTVRDPRSRPGYVAKTDPSWVMVLAFLRQHWAIFTPHILGYTFAAASLFGLLSWSPAYLIRVHGLTPQTAGLALGFIALLCNGSGVLVSGILVDRRYRAGHDDGPFRVGIIGVIGLLPPLIVLPLLSGLGPCLVALAVAMFFASFPMPPSVTLIQTVAPASIRSRISAIFLFVNSLIGFGAGAAVIGILDDKVFKGPTGIGLSLPVTAGVAAIVSALLLTAGIAPLRAFMQARRAAP
jgi:MFS family permease